MEKRVHTGVRVSMPDGHEVVIDQELVPLMKALWAMEFVTLMSCQDVGEAIDDGGTTIYSERHADYYRGRVWLKLPILDGQRLLRIVEAIPDSDFREHLRGSTPECWTSTVYLWPTGLADWVDIYFPRDQLPALVAGLAGRLVSH